MTPPDGHPSGGENLDRAARDSIRLAHQALERFPELVRRHKFIAGGAAISSSLIVLAGVAIARRIRAGQTPEEAVETVTEDEMQGLRVVEAEPAAAAAEPEAGESLVDIEEAIGNGEAESPDGAFVMPASIASRGNGAT